MTYWIYNMGLPIQVSSQRLLDKRKVQPLSKLAKTAVLHDGEEQDNKSVTPLTRVNKQTNSYEQGQNHHLKPVHLAAQIMSPKVIALSASMTFKAAWQHFLKHRFRHFPVTDEKQQLVGILSDRDMLTQAASGLSTDITINQLMKNPVLTASDQTAIREVCQVMFSQHIGALPITNDKGDLLGIITRSDILRSMIEHGPVELWV